MPPDNTPSLSDFLSKASTHGEIGAALIGFAAGVVIDGFLHSPAGIPPSTGGVIGLSSFLGIKHSLQAIFGPPHARRKERRRLKSLYEEVKRGAPPQTIHTQHDLWERGIISDEEFQKNLNVRSFVA